jgi:hypothetical protein
MYNLPDFVLFLLKQQHRRTIVESVSNTSTTPPLTTPPSSAAGISLSVGEEVVVEALPMSVGGLSMGGPATSSKLTETLMCR